MISPKVEILALLAGAALALSTSACVVVDSGNGGSIQNESKSLPLQGAQSADVEVEMGAGELQMRGGSTNMMDADFRYRSSHAKPDVNYNVSGSHGVLTVRQPSHTGIGGNDKNNWDLRLNEEIPLDVRVKMGAGEGRLNLGHVSLRRLTVEIGAGELKLDLTGHPRNDVNVEVNGGVGEATLHLPKKARVEVEAHGGLGEISAHGLTKRGNLWVNDDATASDAAMHVTVHGGIGQINLYCE